MTTSSYTVEHEDVVYAEPGGEPLHARVYRPLGAGSDLPALVDVHGGAWTYFDRTGDMVFDHALAACGMVVVALDSTGSPRSRSALGVAVSLWSSLPVANAPSHHPGHGAPLYS